MKRCRQQQGVLGCRKVGVSGPASLHAKALPGDLIRQLLRNGLIRFNDCFLGLCFMLSIAYVISPDV